MNRSNFAHYNQFNNPPPLQSHRVLRLPPRVRAAPAVLLRPPQDALLARERPQGRGAPPRPEGRQARVALALRPRRRRTPRLRGGRRRAHLPVVEEPGGQEAHRLGPLLAVPAPGGARLPGGAAQAGEAEVAGRAARLGVGRGHRRAVQDARRGTEASATPLLLFPLLFLLVSLLLLQSRDALMSKTFFTFQCGKIDLSSLRGEQSSAPAQQAKKQQQQQRPQPKSVGAPKRGGGDSAARKKWEKRLEADRAGAQADAEAFTQEFVKSMYGETRQFVQTESSSSVVTTNSQQQQIVPQQQLQQQQQQQMLHQQQQLQQQRALQQQQAQKPASPPPPALPPKTMMVSSPPRDDFSSSKHEVR